MKIDHVSEKISVTIILESTMIDEANPFGREHFPQNIMTGAAIVRERGKKHRIDI